jgi:hypothetical protein
VDSDFANAFSDVGQTTAARHDRALGRRCPSPGSAA